MQKRIFVPITKIDVVARKVYGRAASEVPDKVREVFDYETSLPYFKEWSASFEKATAGLPEPSLGNIRAMHGKVAAGKVVDFAANDVEKVLDIGTKIIDDNEWQKVEEGVYTGFSIGGEYVKKWTDPNDKTLTRYTAKPSEISLVDNPCNPDARFTAVKADGTQEQRGFQRFGLLKAAMEKADMKVGELFSLSKIYLPEQELDALAKSEATIGEFRDRLAKLVADAPAPVAKAMPSEPAPKTDTASGSASSPNAAAAPDANASAAPPSAPSVAAPAAPVAKVEKGDTPKEGEDKYGDVKFADAKNKKYPIDTEQHIRAAWSYINKKKNAGKYSAEDLKSIKDAIIAAWKKKVSSDGPPSADDAEKMAASTLVKGMYSVSSLADIIQSVYWIAMDSEYEAEWEQDGSLVPEQLRAWLQLGAEIIKDMAEEEANELVEALRSQADPVILEMATKTGGLAKAGARHSKKDQGMVQKIHDTAASLGASCDGTDDEEAEKMTKVAGSLELGAADALSTLGKAVEVATGKKPSTTVASPEDIGAIASHVLKLATDVGTLTTERETLKKKVDDLEKLPAAGKGVTRVVGKTDDDTSLAKDDEGPIQPDTNDPLAVMKQVHAKGGTLIKL